MGSSEPSADAVAASGWWPWSRTAHGPLPGLLVILTVTTGLVDAVSYVGLGHVFVANMTGNVVFLAFALAGAPGLSVSSSLTALGAFLCGALIGGRIGVLLAAHRGRLLRMAMMVATPLVLLAAIAAAIGGIPVTRAERYALIVTLALAMGTQNAVARRLAVPDLTTTVLTLTLTGVAADARVVGDAGGHPARRLLSVAAMFAGALAGAIIVLHVDRLRLVIPLAIVVVLLAVVGLVIHRHSTGEPSWAHTSSS